MFLNSVKLSLIKFVKLSQPNPNLNHNPSPNKTYWFLGSCNLIFIELSQPNPNLNHNLNPNTTKNLGETR